MRQFSVTFYFFLVLVAPVPLCAQNQTAPETEDEVVRVDTALVTVPVSVKNRNGGFIPNLRRDDFRIFEDDVEQEISFFETADRPFTVALLLDVSDSMKIKLNEIQEAAIAFIEQLRPNERVIVVVFAKQIVTLTDATDDRKVLFEAIRRAQTGGGTSLYDAIETVINQHLHRVAGRKAIVILTDGVDTSSTRATFESSLRRADELNGLIYPIQYQGYEDITAKQFGAANSHLGATIYTTPSGEPILAAYERGTRYLRMLASNSGGRFYYADKAKNLVRAFTQIAEELRQQYSLGYYPKNQTSERAKRRIKVRVNVSEGIVRARDGYTYTSQPPPKKNKQ